MSASAEYNAPQGVERLDTATVSSLRELLGNEKFAGLIDLFFDNSKGYIDSIANWKAEDGFDALKFPVHSLKGSSGNVGASLLASICLELENHAKAGAEVAVLQDGIRRILEEYKHSCAALAEML